jgi:molecular chaperone DnaK
MVFTTVADNQTVVEIHVLQGERDLAKFNRSLAKFDLMGIAAAPRGAPQIEVSFDMDANGILSVSAKDKLSGKEQAIRITPSTGLSKDEIDRIVLEAKQFTDKDRQEKQLAELRNRVSGQASALVRSYSEFGRLLDNVEQDMIKDSLQKAKNLSLTETDPTVLRELLTQLESGAARLSAIMFSAPGDEGGQGIEWANEGADITEADARNLMKSALKDIDSKRE